MAKKKKPRWIAGADPDERSLVEKIDLKIKKLTDMRKELSKKRSLITNRCIHRVPAE